MISEINCILLCAGRGSRMSSNTRHKVCFDVDGVPAIHRIISNFKNAGINKIVAVVGSMAGQVVECIGNRYEDVGFVFQKTPLGTGDAARKGVNLIKNMDIKGPILISMGDKLIEPDVIKKLADKFDSSNLDMVLAVQPKEMNSSGGRIILDDNGRLRGICESIDVKSKILYKNIKQLCVGAENDEVAVSRSSVLEMSERLITDSKKRALVLSGLKEVLNAGDSIDAGRLASLISGEKECIQLGNGKFDPVKVENAKYVNAAVYLFKPEALCYALDFLSSNNIQKEFYLTDVVNILSNTCDNNQYKFKVGLYPVQGANAIMSYNNMEELQKIESYYRSLREIKGENSGLSRQILKPVHQWLNIFLNKNKDLHSKLQEIYGKDEALIEERRQAYIRTLQLFERTYGSGRQVIITRAPGRVNLMGRHVEHRGGHINVIAVNKEVLAVVSPGTDSTVNIVNTDAEFQDRSFKISDYPVTLGWKDWLSYLESDETRKIVADSRGDWMNYVKAAVLRLQYEFKDKKLTGMDMAFDGNIPRAAGLSSSSAVVVAAAEAAAAINKLNVSPGKFIELCGEGEWFTGSRGGAGDHAAIKLGSRGHIAHVGFFPFMFEGAFPFPDEYRLIVANSHIKAQKTTNARDTFNQRVASYEFGLMMLKEKFPRYAGILEYLRDLNPEKMQVNLSKIYEMILELPEKVTPEEIFDILPGKLHDKIRGIMKSHKLPEYYIIRSVVLFGAAECERSKSCRKILESGNFEGFGKLMSISHDGDRVISYNENLEPKPINLAVTDEYLKRLISDSESKDQEKAMNARLEFQPGGYACSTPEIDLMVDIAKRVPGVIGAQISGAGLGGCIMVLAKKEAVGHLADELEDKYYNVKGLEPAITVCTPVKGSCILEMQG